MTWLARLGWAALAAATLAVAVGVYAVPLPEPRAAIVIDHASFAPGDAKGREVALPHIVLPRGNPDFDQVRYVLHVDLKSLPDQPLFLFIPTLNRPVTLTLNGTELYASDVRALWSGPLIGVPVLLNLPRPLLIAGRNELRLIVDTGQFAIPSYLSKLYLGSEEALAPAYKLRVFLEDRLKTMALAAHVLLGIGVIFAYFYRPRDPLFSWLAAMVAVSFVLSVGMFAGFQPDVQSILPYIAALSPGLGFVAIGVTFALIGTPPPKAVPILAVLVPCITVLVLASGIGPDRLQMTLINIAILIAAFAAATGVVAWGAFRRGGTEARLMLPPFFLVTWLLIHDAGIAADLHAQPFILLTPYGRPVLLAMVMAVLMRRLAVSLDHLDRANENLNRRLAEQEAELAALHHEERIEAARLVRAQERERLTHDLHDGISGHLVSIIAMTERAGAEVEPIEKAARQALDDLRLVIYSLDLGDRELPLALANFRERLMPQLRRIGVELDWSIAGLPEVSGVTPGNALSILRIMQEALTNALKHGPARKIVIRGAAAGDKVAIVVENDGRPFVAGGRGHGLENMRRRAHHLKGEVRIDSLAQGVRLTLLLPLCLPGVEDAATG